MVEIVKERWVCSWASSISGVGSEPYVGGTTLREVAHVAIEGSAIRLRFTNVSEGIVQLTSVTVGLRRGLSAATRDTPLTVTMGGKSEIVLPPRNTVYSDPVPLPVAGGSELLISLYSPYDGPVSVHPFTNSTQYRAEFHAGDRTHDREAGVFVEGESSTSWLDAIDLLTPAAAGAIVVLGDSMSDRSGTAMDTFAGWTDLLGKRLAALAPDDLRRRTVVTAGIGGNTLAAYGDESVGPPGLARLERDALSQSGTTDVLVFEGTNDLLVGSDAVSVIRALQKVAQRCQGVAVRPLASTLLPRGGGEGWDDAKSSALDYINGWLRKSTEFDAVLDFGAILDDGTGRLAPDFDADGTHPNQAGHRRLAESIDLDLLLGDLKAARPDRGRDQVEGHGG